MDKENSLVVPGEGGWEVSTRGEGAHFYGVWQIIMYNQDFIMLQTIMMTIKKIQKQWTFHQKARMLLYRGGIKWQSSWSRVAQSTSKLEGLTLQIHCLGDTGRGLPWASGAICQPVRQEWCSPFEWLKQSSSKRLLTAPLTDRQGLSDRTSGWWPQCRCSGLCVGMRTPATTQGQRRRQAGLGPGAFSL